LPLLAIVDSGCRLCNGFALRAETRKNIPKLADSGKHMLLSMLLHARPSSKQQDAQASSATAIFLWPISGTLNQLHFDRSKAGPSNLKLWV